MKKQRKIVKKKKDGTLTFTQLSALRREHIGAQLFGAFRTFEQLALKKLAEKGFTDLRRRHQSLTRHMQLEGTRTTDIAEAANMTKQAVGQLVNELEKMGYVERLPDPSDGRAKLVSFSAKGLRLIATMAFVIPESEAEIARSVGQANFAILKRALKRLAQMPVP